MELHELSYEMNPIERLTKEIELNNNETHRYLGKLLLEEFNKNDLIANAYKEKNRDLEGCYKSLENYAQNNKLNCIDDDKALEIVLHYIQDEPILTSNKSLKLSVETQEDIKKQAEKDFYEEEMLRLRQERNSQIEKEKEEKEKHQAKEQAKFEKLSENQMSLFDL